MFRLDLVFLWHMHQPDYRDHGTGEFVLPWVYLHALKDYSDMAAHLERHPQIRAVVNFVPVLLEQIEDYVDQFDCGEFRDPLLRLLATKELWRISDEERAYLRDACFRCNQATMITPFAHYQRLLTLHTALGEGEGVNYFCEGYYADLLTWYHLAWSGDTERRSNPFLRELLRKGEGFSFEDRQQILTWIGATMRALIPRYRALQARGQIEVSTTPQTHPLGPLMLDFNCARESQPGAPLPQSSGYPGGEERFDHHIEDAQLSHAARFGRPPSGMWPAEGAISDPVIARFGAHGVQWAASGEGVLNNSLNAASMHLQHASSHPWQLESAPQTTLFFRNERLSDLIGFEYSRWHSGDAARHFVTQLDGIAAAMKGHERPVVSVMLDGENAWEYYPYNGYYFFDEMYSLLARHREIRTTTFSELLASPDAPKPETLPHLVAGSWVYGTLSTWIGEAEKNRAWDLLCAAKLAYDSKIATLDPQTAAAATAQLAVCESSDWFWWFGDYNPSASVASFDSLFRRNLSNLYQRLELAPPPELQVPISAGHKASAAANSGTMRRAH